MKMYESSMKNTLCTGFVIDGHWEEILTLLITHF